MNDSTDMRANPDELLRAAERERRAGQRGHLKIFFGYAAGVGKTYAMLEAAHAAKARGVDVVVGYVEPHARPATLELLKGLEAIEPLRIEKTVPEDDESTEYDENGVEYEGESAECGEESRRYDRESAEYDMLCGQFHVRPSRRSSVTCLEFDLDAALERAPELVIVDELAHTCAPGSRHQKRYQDVRELLQAGINVYTTVNVQHIESLCDLVASITGVIVRERIPDHVFDEADQVELVDIEPADLMERLKAGQVYAPAQAARALDNFFSEENLTALREIALRRCADRVNLLSEEARAKSNRDYHTGESVLVCVSPSATNPTIVRTASRMAQAFHAELCALYVRNPDAEDLSEDDERRLHANLDLAESLGAHVVTVTGDDVAYQIAEYARISGASKLVMGRNTAARSTFGRPTLADRLIALAPNLDIYIIPDRSPMRARMARGRRRTGRLARLFVRPRVSDVIWTVALLAGATALGYLFTTLGFATEDITSVYVLATLVCSVVTSNRACALSIAALSVLTYNFCFVEPLHTLAFRPSAGPTFVIMFATAVLSSMLASLVSDQARQSALTAYRTKVLFDTSQLLAQVDEPSDVYGIVADQLVRLLGRDVVLYPEAEGHRLGAPSLTTSGAAPADERALSESEAAVASWVFKNNKRAGATTTTLPDSHCLYLAIRARERVFGVVGIVIGDEPLDAFENSTTLSILGEGALALESKLADRERREAEVMAKNEQLKAGLLRAVGHDLRTPLTAIAGSADLLVSDGGRLDAERREELLRDINRNSLWLISIVENLLAVTRVEEGSLSLNLAPELLDEAVDEAVSHLERATSGHRIRVEAADEVLMAKMDVRLIVQVVVNLLDNALKYAPSGTEISVSTRRAGSSIVCEVADLGPGVADAEKDRVFETFYTVTDVAPVDGRRSLGLGLSLCRSIIDAHGGRIWVRDNEPRGAVFGFSLPAFDPALEGPADSYDETMAAPETPAADPRAPQRG